MASERYCCVTCWQWRIDLQRFFGAMGNASLEVPFEASHLIGDTTGRNVAVVSGRELSSASA
jgi:hypothetical protein